MISRFLKPVYHLFAALVVVALLYAGTTGYVAAAQGPVKVDPRFDLTGNKLVNVVDAESVTNAWALSQEQAACVADGFASRDINGDGCIDVADAQLIAAQMGNATDLNAPQLRFVGDPATQAEITLTVNSTGSEDDTNLGDGNCNTSAGTCTLRAALQEASSRPGPEKIAFNIPGSGTATIKPVNATPEFFMLEDQDASITIDGYTQTGAQPNTSAVAGNAVIKIEVDGASSGPNGKAGQGIDGITIASPNNVVKGLAVLRWDHQIILSSFRSKYNHVEGNFIGTNAAQSYKMNSGTTHHYEGLRMRSGASYNIVGCGTISANQPYQPCANPADAYAARNIISGNGNDGIHLQGNGTISASPFENHVVGNFIGVKQNGVSMLANKSDAVDFEEGAFNNWLGGPTELERNIISGNGSEGIELSHNSKTIGNHVAGNYFGLDVTGTQAVRNCGNGISFEDTPNHNFAYKNRIAGNYGSGVRVYRRSTHNEIYENIIGIGVNGEMLPNGLPDNSCDFHDYGNSGVFITGGGQYNVIRNNIIANHPKYGIDVDVYTIETGDPTDQNLYGNTQPTSYNTISQNSIYNNGLLGIRLKKGEKNNKTGIIYTGNDGLVAPNILNAGTNYVVGTACIGCVVEVFIADPDFAAPYPPNAATDSAGEGKTFLGSAMTNSAGQFNIDVSGKGLTSSKKVTATATDSLGNTSAFAANKAVQNGTIPTLTPAPSLVPTVDVAATETASVVAPTATSVALTAEAQQTQSAQATAVIETATAEAIILPVTQTAAAAQQTATVAARATATSLAATAAADATAAPQQTATTAAQQTVTVAAQQTATAVAQTATVVTGSTPTPMNATPKFHVMLPLITN